MTVRQIRVYDMKSYNPNTYLWFVETIIQTWACVICVGVPQRRVVGDEPGGQVAVAGGVQVDGRPGAEAAARRRPAPLDRRRDATVFQRVRAGRGARRDGHVGPERPDRRARSARAAQRVPPRRTCRTEIPEGRAQRRQIGRGREKRHRPLLRRLQRRGAVDSC